MEKLYILIFAATISFGCSSDNSLEDPEQSDINNLLSIEAETLLFPGGRWLLSSYSLESGEAISAAVGMPYNL